MPNFRANLKAPGLIHKGLFIFIYFSKIFDFYIIFFRIKAGTFSSSSSSSSDLLFLRAKAEGETLEALLSLSSDLLAPNFFGAGAALDEVAVSALKSKGFSRFSSQDKLMEGAAFFASFGSSFLASLTSTGPSLSVASSLREIIFGI